MAKEKLVTIQVHTPFTLTLGDQSKQEFNRGRHNVPESVATHWFTQAHTEQTDGFIADTGDQQAEIDSLRVQITDKDKLITDLKDALTKLNEQNEILQTQLATSLIGGEGGKGAKESKSANGK
ncbi:hypothetical protein RYR42_002465 [Edwardsiella piscicida]|nr:hypothetical protein [Edwardsiella piscicida]